MGGVRRSSCRGLLAGSEVASAVTMGVGGMHMNFLGEEQRIVLAWTSASA